MLAIRAIYKNGHLQLLESVDLQDGEEVHIHIVDKEDLLIDLVSDLIVKPETTDNFDDIDEVAFMQQLDAATKGVTLSDIVIEERRSGI